MANPAVVYCHSDVLTCHFDRSEYNERSGEISTVFVILSEVLFVIDARPRRSTRWLAMLLTTEVEKSQTI